MASPISSICSSFIPSVVVAGVPTLTPEVYQGPLASKGMLLRLTVKWASRRAISAWPSCHAKGGRNVEDHQVVIGAAGGDFHSS